MRFVHEVCPNGICNTIFGYSRYVVHLLSGFVDYSMATVYYSMATYLRMTR